MKVAVLQMVSGTDVAANVRAAGLALAEAAEAGAELALLPEYFCLLGRNETDKLALADFAVTQFFFEASEYTSLVADLADRDVTKPVLPGIMPVTSLTSVPRMAAMGAAVPPWMVERLEAADARGGAAAVRDEGVACATELCRELLEAGVPGLHFYTLNRSNATREIYAALGLGPPSAD